MYRFLFPHTNHTGRIGPLLARNSLRKLSVQLSDSTKELIKHSRFARTVREDKCSRREWRLETKEQFPQV